MPTVDYQDLADLDDQNYGTFAPLSMFGAGLVREASFNVFTLTGREGISLSFEGPGFTYNNKGQPLTGRATSVAIREDGVTLAVVSGIDASAKELRQLNNAEEFLELLGNLTANGSAGEDVIVSYKGDDTLRGREGEDVLIGFAGDDKLFGGADDDVLYFGEGRDSLDGGDGLDIAAFSSGLFGFGTADLNLDLRKSGFQKIEGGDSVKLYTMEGIYAGDGDDRLTGDVQANVLNGGRGKDTISGGGGDDTIGGGAGADVLKGGEGRDTLVMEYSGSSQTRGVTVSLAKTGVQDTGDGKDRISGFENLQGTYLADRLTGDAIANRIEGGSGDDTITGGGGRDALEGGSGVDRFVFNARSLGVANTAEILDFEVASGDVMDLSAIDANSMEGGNQAFSFIGTGAFTGVAGQLRWSYFGNDATRDILVQGDINGDGAADLFIQLLSPMPALLIDDFVL